MAPPRLLLALVAAAAALAACAPRAKPPNVVVVLLDTVRADRLSCYGYRRLTTPHLDALAARGIRFEDASSTSSWTLPAHASLFTGRFPIEHGATQEHTHLDAGPATLGELLAGRGYATFGASANAVVSEKSGLTRGFQRFVETWRGPGARATEPEQHPNLIAVRRFLSERPAERPFFVFLNYIEAHAPYTPPEPWRSQFLRLRPGAPVVASAEERRAAEHYLGRSPLSRSELAALSDLYDGELAHLDAVVGALLAELERAGALENTLLVVASDHGENLGDHGHLAHVFSLYRTTVRVPLILVLPDGSRAGEVRREPVSLVDVPTTILALVGAPPPDGLPGRDLLHLPGDATPVFAEYYYPLQALTLFGPELSPGEARALEPYLRRLRSVEVGDLRFIWSSDGRHELYNLTGDPDEQRNLSGEAWVAERERRLAALLGAYVERGGGPRPLPESAARRPEGAFSDLDEESAERLKELGYVP